MAFLDMVKQKLEELEQQARLLHAMEQSSARGGAQSDGDEADFEALRRLQNASQSQQQQPSRSKGGKLEQRTALGKARSSSSMASKENFRTPSCPTEGGLPPLSGPEGASPRLGARLVDDLHGRLDEAFLLSEILGPPRCVRGWNGD